MLSALLSAAPITDPAAFCNVLGVTIVNYIKANGVVDPAGTPTPLTAPVGGGPVTGTGKIL